MIKTVQTNILANRLYLRCLTLIKICEEIILRNLIIFVAYQFHHDGYEFYSIL